MKNGLRGSRFAVSACGALLFACSEGAGTDPIPNLYPEADSLDSGMDGKPKPFGSAKACVAGFEDALGYSPAEMVTSCACASCLDLINDCKDDAACAAVVACARTVGCSGTDCYQPDLCMSEIDRAGLGSPVLEAASAASDCIAVCEAGDAGGG